MAYISIKPQDFYNQTLFVGNESNNPITGVGFQPDFVWVKGRNYSDSAGIWDSVRGAEKRLIPSSSAAESSDAQSLKSFDSDGFTLGTENSINKSGYNLISWNMRAGTTSGITTDGSTTITPSAYSFNQNTGYSIVKYTGNNTSGAKIAHGLGTTPDVVIVKRTGSSGSWDIVSKHFGSTYYMRLDTTGARATGTWAFNDTLPDSVNFTVGDNAETNSSDGNVAYCFASKKGFSSYGIYYGNGSGNGPFIPLGFEPAMVIVKALDLTSDWQQVDTLRHTGAQNKAASILWPNLTDLESTDYNCYFLSNGFKWNNTGAHRNDHNQTFLYMAWAELPFASSNSKAGTAR